ncbi:MAG: sensor histidine kinase [Cyclobacteriaceae bacterium]
MKELKNSLSWLARYKIHHLVFWASYHFVWWGVHEGDFVQTIRNVSNPPYTVKYLFYVVVQTVSIYFVLYNLIPRLLEKRKYVGFFTALLGTLLTMSGLIISGYFLSAMLFDTTVMMLFNFPSDSIWWIFKIHAFPSSLATMTLGMSIKLAKNYLVAQQRQQELEKEKLETELKFLKSQFNPHFLFNTINSIFVLINKDTSLASDSLAKFSSLLRYQLYECNEPQIPLNRELAYLESFVELERLRLDNDFEIKMSLPSSHISNLSIAPFVLMPFAENAFKHVSKSREGFNWIKIDLIVNDNEMSYTISNSTSSTPTSNDAVEYGGLGLSNVKRRLDLLYPNRHELIVDEKDGVFLIKLSVQLESVNEGAIKLIES